MSISLEGLTPGGQLEETNSLYEQIVLPNTYHIPMSSSSLIWLASKIIPGIELDKPKAVLAAHFAIV
jgi:hypothetical protein